jgi:3-isopropylmalate/(R)-2-methylmalate dehydratase small subunit
MTAQKEWIVEGNAWKVGNNVNTESITPSRWLHEGPGPMREHIAEMLIPEFPKKVQEGDVWCGGTNLGCSSSRNAPLFMKHAGLRAIVCGTAARIFYRNAVNSGLPIFEIGDAADDFKQGDRVQVNIRTGAVKNLTTGKTAQAKPFPQMIMDLLEAGSVNGYIRAHKERFPLLKQG